jgi:HSP20 family molecular chaperone IbpA
MLFNLWKMFNPMQHGEGNPFQQAGQQGFDPSNLFGKSGMPFDSKMMENGDWVDNYVQTILKQSFSQQNENNPYKRDESAKEFFQTKGSIEHEIFEMHDYIIVRIPLPLEANPDGISLSLINNRLIVKGHPVKEEATINLPSVPSEKKIGAKCKNHVIEVRLRKRQNEPVVPIAVRFD